MTPFNPSKRVTLRASDVERAYQKAETRRRWIEAAIVVGAVLFAIGTVYVLLWCLGGL